VTQCGQLMQAGTTLPGCQCAKTSMVYVPLRTASIL